MIKILIYEDKTQLREGLSLLLDATEGFKVIAAFKNADNVAEEVSTWNPDVILMDIDMPGTNGIVAVKKIREVNSGVKIIMLTVFDDNKNVFAAIEAGANGYLLKKTQPAKLIECVEEAFAGGAPMTSSIAVQVLKRFADVYNPPTEDYRLSDREKQVLKLLVNGFSYQKIGMEMGVSIDGIRSHIRKIYEKMHVNSRGEAVAKSFKDRIL